MPHLWCRRLRTSACSCLLSAPLARGGPLASRRPAWRIEHASQGQMTPKGSAAFTETQQDQKRLLQWLPEMACPLWSTHGVDRVRGGFHERRSGTQGLQEPRRARVQPRQVSSFAQAAMLGWKGDAAGLATHGLDY